ncbi:MAG TPA: dihydrodipicolinate reductase [Thermoanaerobaculia bacterium]|nr:dihydrodipicolinate reductase [Thermoanaerobaculia bacterium]
MQPITVAQYGIGPIGVQIVKLLLTKPWVKIVAAVDVAPDKVGRDLGEIIGLNRKLGIEVTPTLAVKADVVCHSTGSWLQDVKGQLESLLSGGSHVVSTCEELAFPLDAAILDSLQKTATAANVSLLGTGVNPGFVMDKLPLTLTAVCQDVRSVEVFRKVDAAKRREPLQRKVGAGMSSEQFATAVKGGRIKHMGLRESLMLIGKGLGVEFEDVSDEVIAPMIAQGEIVTQYLTVRSGEVAGVHQTISGRGRIGVSLDIRMYVGADEASDRVIIKGVPDVEMVIPGGVHGDLATAAMAVNCIPRVVAAPAGVLTMDDIPVSYR